MEHGHDHGSTSHGNTNSAYTMLGVNLLFSAIIMYLGMFAMIWSGGEFVQNINFVYMALIMWAPMSAVMLWTMRGQLLRGDRQFLRSMIPHHSSAILMCERPNLADPEIKTLCEGIVRAQKEEIAQMKAIFARKHGS